MVDTSRYSSAQRDLQPVAIVTVDPLTRVATGVTRTRHTVQINCAYATGDTITVPAVGEQWYCERFDMEWRLYGRIPFNDATLNIEPEEGQVSVGSASGPLELNGTEIRSNGTVFRLNGVYYRDDGETLQRSEDQVVWEPLNSNAAGIIQIFGNALAGIPGAAAVVGFLDRLDPEDTEAITAITEWANGLGDQINSIWDVFCDIPFVQGLIELGTGESPIDQLASSLQGFINDLWTTIFCDFEGDLQPQELLSGLEGLISLLSSNPFIQGLSSLLGENAIGNLLLDSVGGATEFLQQIVDALFCNFTGDLTPENILTAIAGVFQPLIDNPFIQGLATLADTLETGVGNLFQDAIAGATVLADTLLVILFCNFEGDLTPQDIISHITDLIAPFIDNPFIDGLATLGGGVGNIASDALSGSLELVDSLFRLLFCDFEGVLRPQDIIDHITDLLTPLTTNPFLLGLQAIATALGKNFTNLFDGAILGATEFIKLIFNLLSCNWTGISYSTLTGIINSVGANFGPATIIKFLTETFVNPIYNLQTAVFTPVIGAFLDGLRRFAEIMLGVGAGSLSLLQGLITGPVEFLKLIFDIITCDWEALGPLGSKLSQILGLGGEDSPFSPAKIITSLFNAFQFLGSPTINGVVNPVGAFLTALGALFQRLIDFGLTSLTSTENLLQDGLLGAVEFLRITYEIITCGIDFSDLTGFLAGIGTTITTLGLPGNMLKFLGDTFGFLGDPTKPVGAILAALKALFDRLVQFGLTELAATGNLLRDGLQGALEFLRVVFDIITCQIPLTNLTGFLAGIGTAVNLGGLGDILGLPGEVLKFLADILGPLTSTANPIGAFLDGLKQIAIKANLNVTNVLDGAIKGAVTLLTTLFNVLTCQTPLSGLTTLIGTAPLEDNTPQDILAKIKKLLEDLLANPIIVAIQGFATTYLGMTGTLLEKLLNGTGGLFNWLLKALTTFLPFVPWEALLPSVDWTAVDAATVPNLTFPAFNAATQIEAVEDFLINVLGIASKGVDDVLQFGGTLVTMATDALADFFTNLTQLFGIDLRNPLNWASPSTLTTVVSSFLDTIRVQFLNWLRNNFLNGAKDLDSFVEEAIYFPIASVLLAGLGIDPAKLGIDPTKAGLASIGQVASTLLTTLSSVPADILKGILPPGVLGQISLSAVADISPNLITLGQFAEAVNVEAADGWTWDGTNNVPGSTGGSARLNVAPPKNRFLYSRQAVPVSKGDRLVVSASVITSGLTLSTGAATPISIALVPFIGSVEQPVVTIGNPRAGSATWVSIGNTADAPYVVTNTSGWTSVIVRLAVSNTATAGTVWWDRVSLTKTGKLEQTNVDSLVAAWNAAIGGLFGLGAPGTTYDWTSLFSAASQARGRAETAVGVNSNTVSLLNTSPQSLISNLTNVSADGAFSIGAMLSAVASALSSNTLFGATVTDFYNAAVLARNQANSGVSKAETTNMNLYGSVSPAASILVTAVPNLGAGKITSGTFGTDRLADDAVTNAKIGAGAVTATEIASLAVGTNQLATDAVTNAKIATNAVNSDSIADLAVGTTQIATDAVTNAKIGPLAVGTGEINSLAVTSEKVSGVDGTKINTGIVATVRLDLPSLGSALGTAVTTGSGAKISRTNTATRVAALINDRKFSGFFINAGGSQQIDQRSADITSPVNGRFTVTHAGYYIVELGFTTNAAAPLAGAFNVAPAIYLNGATVPYKVGTDALGSYGFGAGNYARAAHSTFIVYLGASGYVEAGYRNYGGEFANFFVGDANGSSTYFSIAMLNRTAEG